MNPASIQHAALRYAIALLLCVGCSTPAVAQSAAAGPNDYVTQWSIDAGDEGAYALTLTPAIYAQIQRADLSDLAAFNAAGEALPLGPMPVHSAPLPAEWRRAAWFALPATGPTATPDLHLHVRRGADGVLSLDTTLAAAGATTAATPPRGDLIIDVRADKLLLDGLRFTFDTGGDSFSRRVAIQASDDLEHWRTLRSAAALARLQQDGQTLERRGIELDPTHARYLRVQRLDGEEALPVTAIELRLRRPGLVTLPALQWHAATLISSDDGAYEYRLPGWLPVERIAVKLGRDNAIAAFAIASRPGAQDVAARRDDWRGHGSLTTFALRSGDLRLDSEPLAIATTRDRHWRLRTDTALVTPPTLKVGYRPETWLLLTHGDAPYALVAGSALARRGSFPLDALLSGIRAQRGAGWQPAPAALGDAREAGGVAVLKAYSPEHTRTWLLWGVLLLAAGAIGLMVLRLLRQPVTEGDADQR